MYHQMTSWGPNSFTLFCPLFSCSAACMIVLPNGILPAVVDVKTLATVPGFLWGRCAWAPWSAKWWCSQGFLSPSGKAVGVWTRHALQLWILLNYAFEQCISPLFSVVALVVLCFSAYSVEGQSIMVETSVIMTTVKAFAGFEKLRLQWLNCQ